jgi:predicted enzyme related to lactoylglutathione lyase
MENTSGPTFANGKICYLEIPALDITISCSFYEAVFGWHIRNDNQGNANFDDTTGNVSGMWVTGRPASTEPGILVSIMVDDIVETLNLIKTNGGIAMPIEEISEKERMARFSDPAGNVFSLYQYGH